MLDSSTRRRWSTVALFGTMAIAAACRIQVDIMVHDGDAGASAPGDAGADAGDAGISLPQPGDPAPPPSLRTVKIPDPTNLGDFVRDRAAAIVLGKAFFWDMQVGGDGIQACGSCHFHAGADSRSKNQLNPGIVRTNPDLTPNEDKTFQLGGPNYQLQKSDFPLTRKADPNDRTSAFIYEVNDVVASQGVTSASFVGVNPGNAVDDSTTVPDENGFSIAGINTRQAEQRHTPSVINAAFTFRNFWDGRAQHEFNGVNQSGDRDVNARVLKVNGANVEEVRLSVKNASLASQALQPVNNPFEMAAKGRTFADLGRKFTDLGSKFGPAGRCGCSYADAKDPTTLRPLGKQLVASDDSVLGPYSRAPKPGLTVSSYHELIEKAFQPAWWQSDRLVRIDRATGVRSVLAAGEGSLADAGTHTLLEANFSLFFGLAVQLYEMTLVADQTPLDDFLDGDKSALTSQQQFGLLVFLSQARGRCINCHGGPELSDASTTRWSKNQIRRRNGNVIDFGFNNIGVRSTFDDIGNGANDPYGNPLSVTLLALQGKFTDPSVTPPLDPPNEIQAVDGAFKVPMLRNVELTAPYFHNGGYLSLVDVIQFYSRGGDFNPIKNRNGVTVSPLDVLNNTQDEKDALLALLFAITDERVRFERAPFDHPQIFVPNGHKGNSTSVVNDGKGNAQDEFLEVEAVGRGGRKTPAPNFLQ